MSIKLTTQTNLVTKSNIPKLLVGRRVNGEKSKKELNVLQKKQKKLLKKDKETDDLESDSDTGY